MTSVPDNGTASSYARSGFGMAVRATLGLAMLALSGTAGAVSAGSTHYVAPGGHDSNRGTVAAPWRTIGKAAASMDPGDTAVVAAGTYTERVRVDTRRLSFVADGKARMAGFTVLANGVTVRGFEIEAEGCGWRDDGIFVDASDVVIEDNFVFNSCRGGIRIEDGSDNTIRNNRLRRNATFGIHVDGQNHTVDGNEIWNSLQRHPKYRGNVPSWADANGIFFFGSGHTFTDNYIHDISFERPANRDPHIDCFQTWGGASDILFEGNRCEVPTYRRPGESGTAFMLAQASNIRIRRNLLHAFNFVNTGGGGVRNVELVNNVLIGDAELNDVESGTALAIGSEPNSVARNNLGIDIYIRWAPPGHSWAVDHNALWRTNGTLPLGNPGPGSLWGIDPRIDDDYVPLDGSPLIDAGIDVGLPFFRAAPDIGRVEKR